MTTEEKMRIIHNWTDAFIMRSTPHGYLYGELWFNGRARVTCNHMIRGAVISEAYGLTNDNTWYEIRMTK